MFNIFNKNTPIAYGFPAHKDGYPLGIEQETKKNKNNHRVWVRLLVDHNTTHVLAEIFSTDPQDPIQTYPLSEEDEYKIVRACQYMIRCVRSDIFDMTTKAKKELDAVIQPYLDRLHEMVTISSSS